MLAAAAIDTLVELIEAEDAARSAVAVAAPPRDLNDWERQRIIELLRRSYVGEYTTWRNIGWGLKAGGFTLNEFQYVTGGMMSAKTPEDAATLWNAGSESGGITLGTVIHFLKSRHGENCLREDWKSQREKLINKYQ